MIKEVKCVTNTPWFFSCGSLLKSTGVKVSFYCVSTASLVFDSIHVALQYKCFCSKIDKTFAYRSIATATSLTDIFLVMPLIFLWAADVHFKEHFPFSDYKWRSGSLCYLAFGFFLNFDLLSLVMMSFSAISRFMIVIHPVDTTFKVTKMVLKYLTFIVVICSLVSFSLSLVTLLLDPVLPFALCFPFCDPPNKSVTIDVITWFIVVLQSFSTIFCLIMNIKMYHEMRVSRKKVASSVSHESSHLSLLLQLMTISFSSFICWTP